MPGRLSILIAEDGAADRMLLAAIVRRQGHRVTTAANGAEAISLFERERPQLVLMDALMPVMDGFEAAQQIKRLAGNELVPIIFLTSLTENEALVRCLEAGGDDFIAKPYNPIILEAACGDCRRLYWSSAISSGAATSNCSMNNAQPRRFSTRSPTPAA